MKKYLYIFILVCLICIIGGNLNAQNRAIDSLKLEFKNAKHDTARCKIYNGWGEQLYYQNPDSAFALWQKTISIAEDNLKRLSANETVLSAFKREYANALSNVSAVFVNHGNLSQALQYCKNSLKIREEINDKVGVSTCLLNMGTIFNNQGDNTRALEYFFQSLKIGEEIGDKEGIAYSLNFIGIIYQNQKDLSKALEFHQKSLEIKKALGNKFGMSESLNNMGVIYKMQNNDEKALACHLESMKINEEIGDKSGLATSLNNISNIYYDRNSNTKAIEFAQKSLCIQQEIQDKSGMANSLANLAMLFQREGKSKEALSNAIKAMQVAKEIAYPLSIKEAARALKFIYKNKNDYKTAFEMFELEIKMRDSLNNQEIQKATVKKQMQYTYEKQEAVAKAEHKSELEKQQAVANEKNRKQKIVIFSVAIGLLLVVVFAGYVFKTLRATRKQKILIELKNKEIEEKQKEILDSIRYAKRIQMAQIPSEKRVETILQKLRKI